MITYTHKNVNIGKAKAQRWTRESDVGHDPVWRTGDKWTDEALSHHHVIHTVLVLRHFVQKYSRSFLFYPFTCFFLSWLVCLYSIGAIVIEATEIRPDIARPYCHGIVIQLPREPSPIGSAHSEMRGQSSKDLYYRWCAGQRYMQRREWTLTECSRDHFNPVKGCCQHPAWPLLFDEQLRASLPKK